MPEVPQEPYKYIFRYLTKRVNSNVSGDFWPQYLLQMQKKEKIFNLNEKVNCDKKEKQ